MTRFQFFGLFVKQNKQYSCQLKISWTTEPSKFVLYYKDP